MIGTMISIPITIGWAKIAAMLRPKTLNAQVESPTTRGEAIWALSIPRIRTLVPLLGQVHLHVDVRHVLEHPQVDDVGADERVQLRVGLELQRDD